MSKETRIIKCHVTYYILLHVTYIITKSCKKYRALFLKSLKNIFIYLWGANRSTRLSLKNIYGQDKSADA